MLLLAVLSPLAWLMPSRRQRGSMDIRLAARTQGIAMQLAEQQWPHWHQPEPPQRCPQYYVPRRRGRVDSWSYWQPSAGVWVNQWREPCTDVHLIPILAALPPDAYKAEAGSQLVSIFWGERGGQDELSRISKALKALA